MIEFCLYCIPGGATGYRHHYCSLPPGHKMGHPGHQCVSPRKLGELAYQAGVDRVFVFLDRFNLMEKDELEKFKKAFPFIALPEEQKPLTHEQLTWAQGVVDRLGKEWDGVERLGELKPGASPTHGDMRPMPEAALVAQYALSPVARSTPAASEKKPRGLKPCGHIGEVPHCCAPSAPLVVRPGGVALPRRIRLDQNTPAELAIRAAVEAVERAGCDPLLTEAVILLDQAREKVADFVDGTAPSGPVVAGEGKGMPDYCDRDGGCTRYDEPTPPPAPKEAAEIDEAQPCPGSNTVWADGECPRCDFHGAAPERVIPPGATVGRWDHRPYYNTTGRIPETAPKEAGPNPLIATCERYSLARPEFEGVTFCRKSGARAAQDVLDERDTLCAQVATLTAQCETEASELQRRLDATRAERDALEADRDEANGALVLLREQLKLSVDRENAADVKLAAAEKEREDIKARFETLKDRAIASEATVARLRGRMHDIALALEGGGEKWNCATALRAALAEKVTT